MSLRGFFASLALGSCYVRSGSGSPEGAVTAPVGSQYLRNDGGAGSSWYIKESGTGNTGWVAMASASSLTSGLLKQKTVTLTDAQIKALPTTPITLVAAPASGFRHRVLSVSVSVDCTAAAYTNVNTTYADLEIATGTGGLVVVYGPFNDSGSTPALTELTTLLGAGVHVVDLPPFLSSAISAGDFVYTAGQVYDASGQDANSLVLKIDNNGSGALTGGDAANTMAVTVYYVTEAL